MIARMNDSEDDATDDDADCSGDITNNDDDYLG